MNQYNIWDLSNKLTFIGNNLLDTVSQQAERAAYFCGAENIPANQKVHELRRGFKRLRALLRLLYGLTGGNARILAADIRNYGKLLSPLRESAVNCELFDRLAAANELLPDNKIRTAKDQLAEHNRVLIQKGFYENNLQNTIRSYFDGFNSLMFLNSKDVPGRFHIYVQVVKSYKKSYKLYQSLPADPHPEDWHELRKKLKRLWYQLDFIRFLHPRYFRAKTFHLNRFTDQLGEDHDMHVFIGDLFADRFGFDDEELEILKNQVENLREMNQLKLQPRLKQFFTTTPEEFNLTLKRFFRIDTL